VTVDYGAGLKLFLSENVALRADVRHVLPLGESGKYGDNPSKIHNDLLATFGLLVTYGGQKVTAAPVTPARVPAEEKPVKAAPAKIPTEPPPPPVIEVDKVTDSDRDGVPDYLDACPGTPASVVVDKMGCPNDSDGDGVPDYLDQCPGTPRGFPVDEDGCPKISSTDSDRDGVPDYLDKCPGTPYGVAVDKHGCPVPEKEPLSMRLKLEFTPGKCAIKRMYHSELKTMADFLKAHPGATATIVGHTDDVGNRQNNIRLSQARADSVKQYLVSRFGIKSDRIRTMGYGPDKPIASNKTKKGRQANRRVIAFFETAP
jgi:OOP family OmpA-OmpF porin